MSVLEKTRVELRVDGIVFVPSGSGEYYVCEEYPALTLRRDDDAWHVEVGGLLLHAAQKLGYLRLRRSMADKAKSFTEISTRFPINEE